MAADAIDAVVFDIGGVLIDWDPRHLYRQLFADAGEMEGFLATVCTGDWHRAHDLGADIAGSCQLLARQFPRYEAMIMAWAERGEEMPRGSSGIPSRCSRSWPKLACRVMRSATWSRTRTPSARRGFRS